MTSRCRQWPAVTGSVCLLWEHDSAQMIPPLILWTFCYLTRLLTPISLHRWESKAHWVKVPDPVSTLDSLAFTTFNTTKIFSLSLSERGVSRSDGQTLSTAGLRWFWLFLTGLHAFFMLGYDGFSWFCEGALRTPVWRKPNPCAQRCFTHFIGADWM